MCGIAGYLGLTEIPMRERCSGFLEDLKHRGPDGDGWLTLRGSQLKRGSLPSLPGEAEILLAHRRLAILDLSQLAAQPMSTADGAHHLIFNGEIYNYLELRRELEALGCRFESTSDTEVLLQALTRWGIAALERFIGMFAFAWLNSTSRELVLARDPYGIKPLYYCAARDGLAFASEIGPLLKLPGISREANPERMYDYLRFGQTDHGGETMFRAIRQLPAGCVLKMSLGATSWSEPRAYWTRVPAENALPVEEAAENLRELFIQSVRIHLRSDVPVGAALSGGLDSSAIVAAIRKLEPDLPLHAFSYIAEEDALNEERWVDRAGAAARAEVHKVLVQPSEMVRDLDELLRIHAEPVVATTMYAQFRVFQAARESGIRVMLDGQGADELLAGYRAFQPARLADLLRSGRWGEAATFIRGAKANGLPFREWAAAAEYLVPRRLQESIRKGFGREAVPPWLNRDWFASRNFIPAPLDRNADPEGLKAELRRSFQRTLPLLLRCEDRNSMAHSVESRVPFLSPPMVDFVQSLPVDLFFDASGRSKEVFRRAMQGLVPGEILERRDKIGFATPEKAWLRSLQPWVEKLMSEEQISSVPPLNGPAVRREWAQVMRGTRPFDFRIWRWVNLVAWARQWKVEFS